MKVIESDLLQELKMVRNGQILVLRPGETSKTMKFNQAEEFVQLIPVMEAYQDRSFQVLMEGTGVQSISAIEDRYIFGRKLRKENDENGTFQIRNSGKKKLHFLLLTIKKKKGGG